MAPGTLRTLAAFTDPTRGPPEARERLSNIILETHPASPFNLDHAKFLKNLRETGSHRRPFRDDCRPLIPDFGQ